MNDLITDYWTAQPSDNVPNKVNIMTSYEQQRRDRLADLIGDYLTDENCSARGAYEEILAEVQGWVDYHKSNLDKVTEFQSLLLGHRPLSNLEIDIKDP